jgi:hypothetical protein
MDRREAIERLLKVWEANPELRLGQLLHNATHGVDCFYLYDDEFVKLLELYLPQKRKRFKKREAKPATPRPWFRV